MSRDLFIKVVVMYNKHLLKWQDSAEINNKTDNNQDNIITLTIHIKYTIIYKNKLYGVI